MFNFPQTNQPQCKQILKKGKCVIIQNLFDENHKIAIKDIRKVYKSLDNLSIFTLLPSRNVFRIWKTQQRAKFIIFSMISLQFGLTDTVK